MEIEIIKKAGLSEPQAKTYLALLKNGELSPTKIAEITGETRTNTYAILEKLEKNDLVKKGEKKTITYIAQHPSVLETIAEKKRRAAIKNEEVLKSSMTSLLDAFYAHSSKPGVKTFIGYDGIKDIYRDVLRTGKTVYLLRTAKDDAIFDFIYQYRLEMAKKGVKTIALTPDTMPAKKHSVDGTDERTLFERVMMPKDVYDIPVALMVYDKKVALVSYGEEEMSVVIDSLMLAESIRQMIIIMRDLFSKTYPQKHLA